LHRSKPLLSLLLLALLGLLPFAAGAGAGAAPPAWALLAEARVAGESIYLSDLLPAEATPGMREAAGKIRLGNAPPPGGTVTLAGERIAGLLPEAARQQMVIPPHVLVHRASRPVTREEVVAAIQAALRRNGLPGRTTLDPEDVHFSPAVTVAATDAKLEVRRIDFDAALQQDRFLLASAADPRVLPFLVLAERPSVVREEPSAGGSEGHDGRDLESALREARPANNSAAFAEGMALVEPKKIAKLHVVSGNMQMFLQVLPLEKGALDETVRVKVAGSGQILRGRVIAPGQLEAQF
jgi:flagellar basal body P-ring formation chaperone FlgA